MSKHNRRMKRQARREAKAAARQAKRKERSAPMVIQMAPGQPIEEVPEIFRTAFVMSPGTDQIGCITENVAVSLQVRNTKEFVRDPADPKKYTPLYKGELFNAMMVSLDSAWPYEGADFEIRKGHTARERVFGAICNVPVAVWNYPAVWPWALPVLAKQIGMHLEVLNVEKVK